MGSRPCLFSCHQNAALLCVTVSELPVNNLMVAFESIVVKRKGQKRGQQTDQNVGQGQGQPQGQDQDSQEELHEGEGHDDEGQGHSDLDAEEIPVVPFQGHPFIILPSSTDLHCLYGENKFQETSRRRKEKLQVANHRTGPDIPPLIDQFPLPHLLPKPVCSPLPKTASCTQTFHHQ